MTKSMTLSICELRTCWRSLHRSRLRVGVL